MIHKVSADKKSNLVAGSAKSDLGLFMKVNNGSLPTDNALFMMDMEKKCEDEYLVLLTDSLEKLCLMCSFKRDRALLDCACPNTVVAMV